MARGQRQHQRRDQRRRLHPRRAGSGTRAIGVSPALARAIAAQPGDAPVRLRIGKNAKPWIFQRLTHEIPAYDGVPIGDRVHLVEPVAQADYEIEPDGTLLPLR